ncbi:MAG: glycerophosphodiester phosphodiesterase [Candidatus Thorarchaeota archaeon]
MQPVVIAHRGASAKAPENTLMAFRTAWQLGAHMIELDVHESSDGHLVCIHDSSIDRTTKGTGEVSDLTLREIQEVDAGMGEKIPLLSEVLEFARGRIQVNIELKIPNIEAKVASLIQEMNLVNDVMVSSFIHLSLVEIKEIDQDIKTAVLFHTEIKDLATYAIELGAQAVNPLQDLVTEAMVSRVHEFGLQIYPWTINDERDMIRLLNLGVDGFITDYPERGVHILRSRII